MKKMLLFNQQQFNKDNKIKAEDMKLIDLDNEEEDRDRDGVKMILQKYNKVFRFLFNKYALSLQSVSKSSFEQYPDKQMSVAEMQKLLKEHELFTSNIASSVSAIG